MIIVSAVMWPQGNQADSYELLNATISNRSGAADELQSYSAHVTSRPKPMAGVVGYEADVEVSGHTHQDGLAPLLMAVLGQAHAGSCPGASNQRPYGIELPSTRQLARVELVDAHQFEELLRANR